MFRSANEFSLYIEKKVIAKRMSYMDAILEYCQENYLEPDDIKRLVNKSLKDKLELEMRDLNYLPKQAKLDI